MKLQFLGIIAVLFLLAGCANLPSQNTWNSLTGQDGRTWGYTQIQEAAQAKAIFSQPFHRKGRGRTYSRHQIKFDQIVLPPNSLNTLKLRTYCLDKSDPAPKRNEKLYLVPVGKMISSQIFPIYSSLMKYSHSHPEKHTQIQRIVWNLRSTKNPSEIRNEDYALLDTIHPGASQIVHSYFNTKKLTGMATDLIADTAGKFLNQHGLGKNLLNQQNLVSTALHSLSQSNRQVNSILRSLESMPVSGLIPNDNSDYSLLTDGVAVKATHRGGARNSELTIRNTTDHPVVFQPAQFALESKRKTQRLGVGGVDAIEEGIEQKQRYDCCNEGLTVYLGGAGMDGAYISDQIEAFREQGVNAVAGKFTTGTFEDMKRVEPLCDLRIYLRDSDGKTFRINWGLEALKVHENLPKKGQFNLMGYSYGSLIAAQSAWYYANEGRTVDNLILVGSPISRNFLDRLQTHPNIRQVIIKNLNEYNDSIYAGMPRDKVKMNANNLINIMKIGGQFGDNLGRELLGDSLYYEGGKGHFYYAPNDPIGQKRRRELVQELLGKGVR
ncbi:MAG: hypothetical protein V8K32_11005 [Candidatus Electrothrix gigas]